MMSSTTLASMKWRKVGFICVFSTVRFTVTSLISGELSALRSSDLEMHFNLSCVVYYSNYVTEM